MASMRQMRPGDWMCPSCNNHNFASKVNCNKCGIPKDSAPATPASTPASHSRPGSLLQQQQAAAASGRSFHLPSYGKQAGGAAVRAQPYSAPPQSPGGMRPGDWCCPSCGNHNYASRKSCGKCGVSKMILVQGMLGGAMMPQQHMMPQHQMQPQMQAQRQAQMSMGPFARPGDWKCPQCENHNYARRTECNKCGGPKQDVSNVPNFRIGDWICPTCSNHNYASKDACGRCGHSKPAGVAAPQATQSMKPGDWICGQCGNHNFQSRAVCNRCSAPPEAPQTQEAM